MRRTTAVVVLEHAEGSVWSTERLLRGLALSPEGTRPDHRVSVADFWHDSTRGLVWPDFVDGGRARLPADHPAWTGVRTARSTVDLQALVVACLDAGGELRGTETVLVVGSLSTDRAFASRVRVHGREIAAAYVSVHATHSIVSHEVGHLMGFEHTWGLHTPAGGVEGPEYGSPYCVMGRAFRDHSVSTPLPPVADGPPADSPFWTQAGPRVSWAEVVAWSRRTPRAPSPPTEVVPVDSTTGADLVLDDRPHRWGRRGRAAVVVTMPGTVDVLVLELRRGVRWTGFAWDARLRLDRTSDPDTQDAPAVVVHRVQDVDRGAGEAVLPHRAWFVGSVAVPPSGDRDVRVGGSTPTVVELRGFDPARGRAWVRVRPMVPVEPHAVHLSVESASASEVVVTAWSLGYERVLFWWEVDGRLVGLGAMGAGSVTWDLGGGLTAEVTWDRLVLRRPASPRRAPSVAVTVAAIEDGPATWRTEDSTTVAFARSGWLARLLG